MIKSVLTVLLLAASIQAAPQGSYCDQIPSNPVAGEIGAQYLTVPGCGGGGGGDNGNARAEKISIGANGANGANGADGGAQGAAASASASTAPSTIPSPPPSSQSTTEEDPSAESPNSSPLPSPSSSPGTTTTTSNNNSTMGSGGGGDSSGNIGKMYKSSITRYGQGPPGTPGTDSHCQAHEGSCGNNPKTGFTAAASEFLYFHGGDGVGSQGNRGGGSGGLSCGTCWKIWGGSDMSGNTITNTPIVVLITNECATQLPGQEKNLCSQTSYEDANSLGDNINMDLCMDSGATQAFWGNPPWGATSGQAQQVDCGQWCGTFADGTKSGPEGCEAPPANYAVTT